jgi:hypothetical protein
LSRGLEVQKRQVRICPAWQIGEHNLDGVGILPDDTPIVPEGDPDPPVLRLLEQKRTRAKRF